MGISSKTLNLLDCTKAFIQVEQNECGFLPAIVDIKDPRLGSFIIKVASDSQPGTLNDWRKHSPLNPKAFSNSLDVSRFRKFLEDEGSALVKFPFYRAKVSSIAREFNALGIVEGKRKQLENINAKGTMGR